MTHEHTATKQKYTYANQNQIKSISVYWLIVWCQQHPDWQQRIQDLHNMRIVRREC